MVFDGRKVPVDRECSVIAGPNQHRVAVVVPAYPCPCVFFRVVRFDSNVPSRGESRVREVAYWNCEEWGPEDTDLTCIGAIAGVIKAVCDGDSFTADTTHEDAQEWEVWR